MERFGPTRRGGPIFRWLGEDLSIDLANTVMVLRDGGEVVDLFADETQLRAWLDAERGRVDGEEMEAHADGFARLCDLRDAVRDLFGACAAGEPLPGPALERLNSAAAQDPCFPKLALRGDGTVELRECSPATGFDRLLGMSARAAMRILGGPAGAELNLCKAPSCGMFFLGRRRWCCSACGNRARVARHYGLRHPRRVPHRATHTRVEELARDCINQGGVSNLGTIRQFEPDPRA
jgi:predicted RNA-binding Zn ribbon-like protein